MTRPIERLYTGTHFPDLTNKRVRVMELAERLDVDHPILLAATRRNKKLVETDTITDEDIEAYITSPVRPENMSAKYRPHRGLVARVW